MTYAARYSIVRFMPYVETEEFANVGVVLFAPQAGYVGFRLLDKWRRIGAFFDTLERSVFTRGRHAFEADLQRVIAQTQGRTEAGQRAFDELVRPREALFRFSPVRVVMTDASEATLDSLFERYVEHDFATPKYQEVLLERALRGVLQREGLDARYRRAKLGTGVLQFPVPFAAAGEDGVIRRVIKPLHMAQEDPLHILDHGSQWVGRLRHLRRVNALPSALLFAVAGPPANTDRQAAFAEVRREMEDIGAIVAWANDEEAILRFAQAA